MIFNNLHTYNDDTDDMGFSGKNEEEEDADGVVRIDEEKKDEADEPEEEII